MKRMIALILAAAMTLSLAACGGGSNMTKEEMLEVAETVDVEDISDDSLANIVNAKEKYCDKVLKVDGIIHEIHDDYVTLWWTGYVAYVNVYLPEEDIANFEPKQKITVVGSMDGKVDETKNPYNGNMDYYYTLEPAYFVTDRYEYAGELNSKNNSYDGAWNIRVEGSSMLPLIHFAEGIDGSEYLGKEITFTAKRIGGDPAFYDAEILK